MLQTNPIKRGETAEEAEEEKGEKKNATVALKGDAEANALVQLTLRETAHGARIATSNTSRLMI